MYFFGMAVFREFCALDAANRDKPVLAYEVSYIKRKIDIYAQLKPPPGFQFFGIIPCFILCHTAVILLHDTCKQQLTIYVHNFTRANLFQKAII